MHIDWLKAGRSALQHRSLEFGVHCSPFTVRRGQGAVRTRVRLLVQYIGNTLGLKITCFRVVGVCKYRVSIRGTGSTQNEQQHGRPDLSTIARAGMLRECLGQVRYVAAADRKKAIVGKSRVEANRLQSPAFVFRVGLALGGFSFQNAVFGGISARRKLAVSGSIQPSKSRANQTSSCSCSTGLRPTDPPQSSN